MFDTSEVIPPDPDVWPGSGYQRSDGQAPAAATVPVPATPPPAAIVVGPSGSRAEFGAGVAFVQCLLGAISGFAITKNLWGAGSGALAVGAIRNGSRAIQQWRSSGNTPESSKSALVAALGLAGAGWLGYNAREARSRSTGEQT